MFAEPEVLFGNLDELCCVTYAFCKEFLNVILQQMNSGELNPSEVLVRLFQKVWSFFLSKNLYKKGLIDELLKGF